MRLIDADNVIFEFNRMLDIADERNARPDQKEEFKTIRTYIEWARYVVECAPTVDAVEIVRCKDCRWYKFETWADKPYCAFGRTWQDTDEDDFCSHGERKEK